MEDYFWLFDTRLDNSCVDRFYGYTTDSNNNIVINEFPDRLCGDLCYTYIKRFDEHIEIGQDFFGTQGIYYYKGDNYYVFSNGFEKLVDYILSEGIHLSFDRDFALLYMFTEERVFSTRGTLIKEICLLESDYKVKIYNKSNVSFEFIDYGINTVNVYSKECVDILDSWYNKWISVFNNILNTNVTVNIDLSGGYDSRCCFGMIKNLKPVKNRISIHCNSVKNTIYNKTIEDWKISEEILCKYDYLDTRNTTKSYLLSVDDDSDLFERQLYIVKNTLLGNARICDFFNKKYVSPTYNICGFFGEKTHGAGENITTTMCEKVRHNKGILNNDDYKKLKELYDLEIAYIMNKYNFSDTKKQYKGFRRCIYTKVHRKKNIYEIL